MRIALDYDDTFTNDDVLWMEFVSLAKRRGHEVAFVTSRSDDKRNEDMERDAEILGIEIVYCSHQPKSWHFQADVWIDDSPETIKP